MNKVKLTKIAVKFLKHLGINQSKFYISNGLFHLFGKEFIYHNLTAFFDTYKEIFEKEIYRFNSINDKQLIIDCGTNMGLSLLFFSVNYPNAQIYGFEPDKFILPYLKRNIQTQQMNNVQLHEKAVWNSNTILDFYTDKGMGGRIDSYSNQIPIKIEAIRLKEFIGTNHVDFLKIDIEGAEYDVMIDCEPILNQIDNIFIEYHCAINKEQKLSEILAILKKNGFRYHLSESFSRNRPFVDKYLVCEQFEMAINIFGFKENNAI